MKFIHSIVIASLLISGSISFIEAQVLPLDSVVSIVLNNNPELKMYDAKAQALDKYAEGAKNLPAPIVSAGPWMTPYHATPGFGQIMIEGEQSFTNPEKLKANANYLTSLSSVEKLNMQFGANDIISAAKKNYYELIILQKKYTVINQNLDILQFIMQTAQTAYQYNKGTLSDYYQVQSRQYELQNMLTDIQNQIKQKRIMLNTFMYRDMNTVFEVDTSFSMKNYEGMLIDSSQLQNARSDVKAINQSIRITELNEKLQRSQRLPDFSVNYAHMFGLQGVPSQFTLMAGISIPIVPWSSKSYKANTAAQQFEARQLQEQKESILNVAQGSLRTIALQIASDEQQKANYEKQILPSMNRGYQASLIAYQQNTGALLELMNAWLLLKNTQLDYYDKIGDLLQQQVEFEKQMEIF